MPPKPKSGESLPPGALEQEFGVPMPGAIVPPALWTPSSLKRWPAAGPLDWQALFGRAAPVVVDLGCGNGRSVLFSAIRRPEYDHLGVDSLPVVIRYARKRARQRGLVNVRFAVGDARQVVARYIAPGSVTEVHVYHPQPYYDLAQIGRRLITPSFLLHIHRILIPGGLLVLQTDNPAYWRYMQQVVPAFFDFQKRLESWPDAPQGRTRREIIARMKGLPVFRSIWRARTDIDPDEARRLTEALPPPVFNADRRLLDLDELEFGGRPAGRGGPFRPPRRRRRSV